MISYLPMVNAWSLAWETLFGDMDKEYPIIDTNNVGAGNTAYDFDDLDYEIDLTNGASADYNMADIDDMYMHHFTNANSPYNDGWTQ